jgi:hypothetical protein
VWHPMVLRVVTIRRTSRRDAWFLLYVFVSARGRKELVQKMCLYHTYEG